MLEQKNSLLEATEGLKRGMFVAIKGYSKNITKKMDGQDVAVFYEKTNVIVHADASYERTYDRSKEMLDVIQNDAELSFEIVRNAWVDENGKEHSRKAKGRTLKTGIKENITANDADWQAAIDKVRKGLVDPRQVTDNMQKVGNSVYDNNNTGKTYLRNVLVHSKTVLEQSGEYPISCSERVNVIADKIREMLPVGKYRTYILDDEMVDTPDGKKVPRFEYVSLMGESVSSSSSSEE